MEWVCTKTLFSNGSVHKGCEKRFTGRKDKFYQSLNFTNITCCAILKVEKHSAFVTEIKMTVWKNEYHFMKSPFPISASPLKCLCSRPLCNSSRSVTIISQHEDPGLLSYFIFPLFILNKNLYLWRNANKIEKYRAHVHGVCPSGIYIY